MLNQKKLIDRLNDLIVLCEDSEEGYEEALKDADSVRLKEIFRAYIYQRQKFRTELQQLVTSLGGDPSVGSSLQGEIHRTWIGLKAALSRNHDEAVLEECQRGERFIRDKYIDLLDERGISPAVQRVLKAHKQEIEEGLENMRRLEDEYD